MFFSKTLDFAGFVVAIGGVFGHPGLNVNRTALLAIEARDLSGV